VDLETLGLAARQTKPSFADIHLSCSACKQMAEAWFLTE